MKIKISKKVIVPVAAIAAVAASTISSIGLLVPTGVEAAEATKTITVENTKVSVPTKGNKWVKVKGYWHFVKNGTLVKGWKNLTKADGEKTSHWSYFDKSNGRLYTGWHYLTSKEGEKTAHWSYFGDNGWLRTGWQQMGKGTNNPDGNNAKHWSYFGSNGWLRTGWVRLGKGTSEPDGNSSVHWSYFGDNGWLRTGWQQMGKGTNNPDGNSAKHWSYFGSNGWLRTGWLQLGKGTSEPDGNKAKHWSYFGANGWLRTELQDMGTKTNPDGNAKQHKSYFGDNGWLRTNQTLNIKGTTYKADSKGWLTVQNTSSSAHTHNWVAQYTTKVINHPAEGYWVECCLPYEWTLKEAPIENADGTTSHPKLFHSQDEMWAEFDRLSSMSDQIYHKNFKVFEKYVEGDTLEQFNGDAAKAGAACLRAWHPELYKKVIAEVNEKSDAEFKEFLDKEGYTVNPGGFNIWKEFVTTKAAWDETVKVANGYKCSTCGAIKK